MESEKVKEIKKALEDYASSEIANKLPYIDDHKFKAVAFADILTLINELESENERLDKSNTSKEESSIEYYNLYKDLKRKNKDLNELCELQRVCIAENFVKENQLKDRIVELEEALLDMVVQFCQMGKEGYLHHAFMSAEENAFDVLDIEYGEKVDDVYKRFNEKWGR
jgi:hypothetical protein